MQPGAVQLGFGELGVRQQCGDAGAGLLVQRMLAAHGRGRQFHGDFVVLAGEEAADAADRDFLGGDDSRVGSMLGQGLRLGVPAVRRL